MGDIYLSFILFSPYLNIKFLLGKKNYESKSTDFPPFIIEKEGGRKGERRSS